MYLSLSVILLCLLLIFIFTTTSTFSSLSANEEYCFMVLCLAAFIEVIWILLGFTSIFFYPGASVFTKIFDCIFIVIWAPIVIDTFKKWKRVK